MRRAALWLAAVAVTAAAVASSGASTTYSHGYDISWPQCSGSAARHLPRTAVGFAILGLTHGRGHTANPCLRAQLAWADQHGVPVGAYIVPSYPTRHQLAAASHGPYGACHGDRVCRLRTDGARQVDDSLLLMHRLDDPAPMVWVDVEFRHVQPWSHDHTANRHVLEGVVGALRAAHIAFGVYTTSYMWRHIVGGWRLAVPNWLPSGNGKPRSAKAMCRTTATGGRTWLVQFTRSLDEDLTCPVMDATPGRPGPLWRYRNTVLRLGSSGSAVRALQRAIGGVQVTGTYDAPTFVAVVQFQQTHDVPPTGTVESQTWRALGAFAWRGGHPFWLSRVVRARG